MTCRKKEGCERINLIRVCAIGILLLVIVACELVCFKEKILPASDAYVEKKTAEKVSEENYKAVPWLFERIGFFAAPILAVTAQSLAYCFLKDKEKNAVRFQREKAWEALIMAAGVFLILLPYQWWISRGSDEAREMFLRLVKWFAYQVIPYCVIVVYHSSRASVLKETPVEEEQILVEKETND